MLSKLKKFLIAVVLRLLREVNSLQSQFSVLVKIRESIRDVLFAVAGGIIMENKKLYIKRGGPRLFRPSSLVYRLSFLRLFRVSFRVCSAFLFCLITLHFTLYTLHCLYAAEDIKAKLNSADGSSTFSIRDSGEAPVATVDSDGNMVLEGSATVKSGGLIMQGASPYLRRGVNNDQLRIAGASDSTDGGCIELYGKENTSSGTVKIIYGDGTAPGSASDAGIVEFLYRTDASWIQKFRVNYEGALYITSGVYVGSSDDEYLGLSNGDLSLVTKHSGWMRFVTAGGSFHWFVDGDAGSSAEAMTLDVNKRLYMGDQGNRYMWDNGSATEFVGDIYVVGAITGTSVNVSSAVFAHGSATDAADEGTLYFDDASNQLKLYTDTGAGAAWVQIGTGPVVAGGGGSGDVTAAGNITDNRLVRGDGGAKGIQESGITIDDTNNVTGVVDLSVNGNTTIAGTLGVTDLLSATTATFTGAVQCSSLTVTDKIYPGNQAIRYISDNGSVLVSSGPATWHMHGGGGESLSIRDGGDLQIYNSNNSQSAILACDSDTVKTLTLTNNLELYQGQLNFSEDPDVFVDENYGLDLGGDETHPVQVVNTSLVIGNETDGTNYSTGRLYFAADVDRYTRDNNYATEFSSNVRALGTIIANESVKYVPRALGELAVEEGVVYYDSTDDQLKLYDASAGWVQIGTGPVVAGGGAGTDADCRTSTGTIQTQLDAVALDTGTYATSPTTHSFIVTNNLQVHGNEIKDSGGSSRVIFGDTSILASSIAITGDVYVGTNTPAANQGSVRLTVDGEVEGYWEDNTYPRYQIDRDMGGSGKAGIGFGAGAAAIDLKMYREDANTIILKGGGTPDNNTLRRADDTGKLAFFSGTGSDKGGSLELFGNEYAGAGDVGRARILVGINSPGFDVMVGGIWDTILTLDTSGNMILDSNFTSDGVNISTAVFVPVSAAPEQAEGMVYYDSDDDHLKLYNGAAWVQIGTGPVVAAGAAGEDADCRTSTGTLAVSVSADTSTLSGLFSALDTEVNADTTTTAGLLSALDTEVNADTTTTAGLLSALDTEVDADTTTLRGLVYDVGVSTGEIAGTYVTSPSTHAVIVTDDLTIIGNDIKDSGGNNQITFTAGSLTTLPYSVSATAVGETTYSIATSSAIKIGGGGAAGGGAIYRADDKLAVIFGVTTGDDVVISPISGSTNEQTLRVGGTTSATSGRAGGRIQVKRILSYSGTQLATLEATDSTVNSTKWTFAGPVNFNSSIRDSGDNAVFFTTCVPNVIVDSTSTFTGGLRINGNVIQNSEGEDTITMEADQDVVLAGDVKVTGNDIQDSGGVAAITFDGSQNVAIGGDLKITTTSDKLYWDNSANGYLIENWGVEYNGATDHPLQINAAGLVMGDVTASGTWDAYRVYVGTKGASSGLGTITISRDNVDGYWEDGANPLWRINRDVGGGGLAGIWLGAGGASAVDTNLYRSAANTLKTDDDLIVTGSVTASSITVSGTRYISDDGTSMAMYGTSGDALRIKDGGDLKIYNAANSGSAMMYCDAADTLIIGSTVTVKGNLDLDDGYISAVNQICSFRCRSRNDGDTDGSWTNSASAVQVSYSDTYINGYWFHPQGNIQVNLVFKADQDVSAVGKVVWKNDTGGTWGTWKTLDDVNEKVYETGWENITITTLSQFSIWQYETDGGQFCGVLDAYLLVKPQY